MLTFQFLDLVHMQQQFACPSCCLSSGPVVTLMLLLVFVAALATPLQG